MVDEDNTKQSSKRKEAQGSETNIVCRVDRGKVHALNQQIEHMIKQVVDLPKAVSSNMLPRQPVQGQTPTVINVKPSRVCFRCGEAGDITPSCPKLSRQTNRSYSTI